MQTNEMKLFFFEPLFLQNNQLNNETVLDYFSISPFYDKESLNEIIRMQSQHTKINMHEHLKRMNGIYYEVDKTLTRDNNLFIIYKKENKPGREAQLITAYYVMFGYIYASPSIDYLSENRVVEILWKMNNCLDLYETNTRFDFLRGVCSYDTNQVEKNEDDVKLLVDSIREFVHQNK
ncbi:MED6 [Enterospora canceri]|uniref:Mediator of RNA polymerase II transcription subunit 6 n=1 Tax=Enterospora canceri TaxID=1081671 RepID=A0A1Y1S8I3_9MICR|nr:MED6 [Enterospora canceri]